MKKHVLILSGPTHEYLDPVRFIGNASSGKMGLALAEEALRRGYTVDFISGPVSETSLPDPVLQKLIRVTSAEEMLAAAQVRFANADIIIFAAAVADYAPAKKLSEKQPKTNDILTLQLRPTLDIAATLCAHKKINQQTIGFALQTHDGENHARRKLTEKKLDGIVLNSPATLGAETGTFSFLSTRNDAFEHWGQINKTTCARHIFDCVEANGITNQ